MGVWLFPFPGGCFWFRRLVSVAAVFAVSQLFIQTECMTSQKDPVRVHVGQLILNAYKAKGLTRYDVAKEIGVNIRSVTSYTQGDGLPKGEKRGRLERFLGWREGAIQDAIVAGSSAVPLEEIDQRWMGFADERDPLTEASADDLVAELLRRLWDAESKVRRLKQELESVKEEVLAQPDYSLAAHRAEPSMIERWRREAEGADESA